MNLPVVQNTPRKVVDAGRVSGVASTPKGEAMSHPIRAALLTSVLSLLAGAATAGPIDGKRLVFRDYGASGKTALTFVSKDPGILVPAPGALGDPSVAGFYFDVITSTETVELRIPGGPGWRVRDGVRPVYMYKGSIVGNDGSVTFVIRDGGLRLRMRGLQFAETSPFEAMAIRVRLPTGAICAAFIGGAVRRDENGVFAGSAATADVLASCQQTTIIDALTPCGLSGPQCGGNCPDDGACAGDRDGFCSCVSPHQPCGDSTPACNGECVGGGECFTINHPVESSCRCAPSGQVPCGATGGTYCPGGSSCQLVPFRFGLDYSACIDDDAVCGEPWFGFCPSGSQCRPLLPPPDIMWSCQPFLCGPYPSCGGACPSGLQCTSSVVGSTGFCFCRDREPDG